MVYLDKIDFIDTEWVTCFKRREKSKFLENVSTILSGSLLKTK